MGSGFFDAMASKGFSYNTTASVRKLTCPRCGFQFSLVYARAIACQGCSEAVMGCPKVRCSKCDMEFPLMESADVQDKVQERTLADHINHIVEERNESFGLSSNNRRRRRRSSPNKHHRAVNIPRRARIPSDLSRSLWRPVS